jgi:hypothetical protein
MRSFRHLLGSEKKRFFPEGVDFCRHSNAILLICEIDFSFSYRVRREMPNTDPQAAKCPPGFGAGNNRVNAVVG